MLTKAKFIWSKMQKKIYCEIVIYFEIELIHVMAKLNFQQLLLQSSVSHDLLEIVLLYWFGAQETNIDSMLKTVLVLLNFVETMILL